MGRTIITDDGRFEWDEDKNIKKPYGVDFDSAKKVFDDKDRIETYDGLRSTYNEERYRVVGEIDNDNRRAFVHVVATELESGRIRIISADPAHDDLVESYFIHQKRKNEQGEKYSLRSTCYRNSNRSKHPHPKKLKVECSLDEDIIQWLKGKTWESVEYPMFINNYLREIMDKELDKDR
jgi:uncharacterized DUF497 family protein